MDNALAIIDKDVLMEKVLLEGDLTQLKPHERLEYYSRVCNSLGLNPTTRPFDYIKLNGKLTLYAKKDATEQLRKINGVSITALDKEWKDSLGLYIVTAHASDKTGRSDAATGAVSVKGLSGEAIANAVMKAETKSKRRVTLSICGLGFVDESELSSIKDATPVVVTETGDIIEGEVTKKATSAEKAADKGETEEQGSQSAGDGESSTPVDMVVIWDGKTQKPANERVSATAAMSFVNTYTKGKDAKLPPAHFKNHVHKHFGIEYDLKDTLPEIAQRMTWAQMTAAIKHLKDGVDTAPWYPKTEVAPNPVNTTPEPAHADVVEDAVAADATTSVASDDSPAFNFGVDLDAVAFKAFLAAKFGDLKDEEKAKVMSAVSFVEKGVIAKDNVAQIAELAKLG